jgi:hypothetical protein
MGGFAIGVLTLAVAGAIASWVIGAVAYSRCIAADEGARRQRAQWLAVAVWPLGLGRLESSKGARAEQVAITNKAIVAFFVCTTLAVATISLSTNFNRLAK